MMNFIAKFVVILPDLELLNANNDKTEKSQTHAQFFIRNCKSIVTNETLPAF